MIDLINLWSAAWLALLWPIVWQSTLLALAAAIVGRGLRRAPPSLRCWLWQAVAFKLLIMPLWCVTVAIPGFAPSSSTPGDGRGPLDPAATGAKDLKEPSLDDIAAAPPDGIPPGDSPSRIGADLGRIDWSSWFLMIWLGGVALGLAKLLRQRARLSHLLAEAAPIDDPVWAPRVREAATALALRETPRALVTAGHGSPFVCGLFRPTLVLPGSLVSTLAPLPARQILPRELAHLKRLDLLWGWIPEIARSLYWFHPVAHWTASRVRLERELACDLLALTHTDLDPAGYAETLLHVVTQAAALRP